VRKFFHCPEKSFPPCCLKAGKPARCATSSHVNLLAGCSKQNQQLIRDWRGRDLLKIAFWPSLAIGAHRVNRVRPAAAAHPRARIGSFSDLAGTNVQRLAWFSLEKPP
jgi:hypothetical protein